MMRAGFVMLGGLALIAATPEPRAAAAEGAGGSRSVFGPPVPYGIATHDDRRGGLPVNTEVSLRLNVTLSSKDAEEGDIFGLTVTDDVQLNGQVVIPAGTQATGRVMGVTRRSIPGQPGRLLIELRSIDLPGGALPVSGTYYERGTVDNGGRFGNPVGAAIVSLFVTGRSAVFYQGQVLKAYTRQSIRPATAAR